MFRLTSDDLSFLLWPGRRTKLSPKLSHVFLVLGYRALMRTAAFTEVNGLCEDALSSKFWGIEPRWAQLSFRQRGWWPVSCAVRLTVVIVGWSMVPPD
jgi:hypothetical protein